MEQVTPCMAVAYLSLPVLGHQWKFMKENHYGASIYIRSDCWHHLLHIFCHHKVDYILYIYKVHFFTVKVKVKALCLYFCARFKALPDDSYYHYWVLSASLHME